MNFLPFFEIVVPVKRGAFSFHIIGAGRSGTSLLTGLIGAHSECHVVSERFSRPNLRPKDEEAASPGGLDIEARARARTQRFLDACTADALRFPAKYWGHKTTTDHVLGLLLWRGDVVDYGDPIAVYVKLTKQIPTLFILRDGRTCVRSKVVRAGRAVDRAIISWKFSVNVLKRLRVAGGPLHVIQFERLVAAPEPELQEICAFLGLSYQPGMLAGTMSEKMRPEYRREGFDLAPTKFDANPVWVGEIAEELLYCGYPLED
ncbi:sulfotransferase family protein [Methylotetracoccus oryzae]|uniref:sulfotransferase family protein n=1 Tax=Methylotetracoccus oryzae TaxID=1919059 RepID=UPI0013A5A0EB|nr:sulfotransferase [Methylotetracoccus oryzae]